VTVSFSGFSKRSRAARPVSIYLTTAVLESPRFSISRSI
jgi:hypothetical protein